MEIDSTSFVLEIINFLVLVWLLKHFLYRPVLDIIAKRQQQIADDLARAEQSSKAAADMVAEYEARNWAIDSERARAREDLGQEIARLRSAKLAALEAEMAAGRSRSAALEKRQGSELQRSSEIQALSLGARFASKLLGRLASPVLCKQLLELTIEQLSALPEATRQQLQASIDKQQAPIQVCSSHALDESNKQQLEAALHGLGGAAPQVEYTVDPALLAGVVIRADSLVLDANLRAELKLFETCGNAS